MAMFFEADTPEGQFQVIFQTRNNFSDGRLRIEPPVQASESFWEYVGAEDEVKIFDVISSSHATMVNFSIIEEPRSEINSAHSADCRIRGMAGILIAELAKLESVDEFLEKSIIDPEMVKGI